jgi:hypothetical protein
MHTLNITKHTEVSNINCEMKHEISTMVICGSHMHKFSVSKDMKKI